MSPVSATTVVYFLSCSRVLAIVVMQVLEIASGWLRLCLCLSSQFFCRRKVQGSGYPVLVRDWTFTCDAHVTKINMRGCSWPSAVSVVLFPW